MIDSLTLRLCLYLTDQQKGQVMIIHNILAFTEHSHEALGQAAGDPARMGREYITCNGFEDLGGRTLA